MLELCADLVISCIIKIIFHLTGAVHHIHQKAKYWKTHLNHKTWKKSGWNDGAQKTASASKNQNVKLLRKKCSWRLEKTWCIKSKHWNSHKKIWVILEARRNPKAWSSKSQSVRVVSRTTSEATEKSSSFILGRHNNTFKKNQSTVQHITFTKLGINQSRKIENPKQQQLPKTKTLNCWLKLVIK